MTKFRLGERVEIIADGYTREELQVPDGRILGTVVEVFEERGCGVWVNVDGSSNKHGSKFCFDPNELKSLPKKEQVMKERQ